MNRVEPSGLTLRSVEQHRPSPCHTVHSEDRDQGWTGLIPSTRELRTEGVHARTLLNHDNKVENQERLLPLTVLPPGVDQSPGASTPIGAVLRCTYIFDNGVAGELLISDNRFTSKDSVLITGGGAWMGEAGHNPPLSWRKVAPALSPQPPPLSRGPTTFFISSMNESFPP